MKTLDEFIGDISKFNKSEYVTFEGFDALYVRTGPRLIHGQYYKVVDIANVTASHPGAGAFKRLIAHIKITWPEHTIHVENVLTKRFQEGLVRMGFIPTHQPMCFYMESNC